MAYNWILFACVIAVISGGLVAGIFLSFSNLVMRSLAEVSPANAIATMQAINRNVYGSLFLILLLGMAGLHIFLSVYSVFRLSGSVTPWIIAGALSYWVGVFLVTILINVPLNKRLEDIDAATEQSVAFWTTYLKSWTNWNHVRTVFSTLSTVFSLVSCILLARAATL